MKSILVLIVTVVTSLFGRINQINGSLYHDDDNNIDQLPMFAKGIRILNNDESTTVQQGRFKRETQDQCDGTTIGTICGSDCKTFMFCAGTGSTTPIYSENCETSSPGKPYCVKGQCTDTPDPSNPKCASSFLCSSLGTFPDPLDCTKFHNCVDLTKPAESYQCPPTYNYMSSVKTCQRTTVCQKLTCPATSGMAAFTFDRAYYGYCFKKPDNSQSVVMYKCPNELDYQYDLATNKCIFNCKSTAANNLNRENCNSYVSCYLEASVYKSVIVPCPVGYYFNAATKLCVINEGQCAIEQPPAPIID